MSDETRNQLTRSIKVLSERLWEGNCKEPDIGNWLANFDGRYAGSTEVEHLHALHLLSSVSYFGLRELRVLLRSMYRDLFRYPLIQELRSKHGNTRDSALLQAEFLRERDATRFIGMGNPAESGTHLLYYFRQENRLPRNLFVHQHELLTTTPTDQSATFSWPELKRVVFIDDLCGSGQQSIEYSRTLLRMLRDVSERTGQDLEFHYLVLFGTVDGMARAESEADFDRVDAVSELDDTYRTFGPSSRVFRKPPSDIDMVISEQVARGYGSELFPSWPLGYDDRQLLLAFHHNVPDNTLPVIWHDEASSSWFPAFPRQPK